MGYIGSDGKESGDLRTEEPPPAYAPAQGAAGGDASAPSYGQADSAVSQQSDNGPPPPPPPP
eukprot:CAMPEP_0173388564 /NCGR_PEP_ID=MMETSP1356-20130122/10843_1 /TAXON_ID=77927 ORGANISM="Hemiselmis virescens, Strain PCC157" /NCGR_SAMPLE_ID=MMETSP1356 /ASSEMBLY_ACC=CAM_ASM_000847 /LENGTH=61 /DNA_ID=CAMNT_0014345503 /DNA_START=69 /DNA_END=251 /DNA_ORIENTATION=+